ncbi:MAG: eukaryotic-like serine/threonine-protein kinase [Verrucomicrobiota bacterium]|jgi:hypothetical protein
MSVAKILFTAVLAPGSAISLSATQIMPTVQGTSWRYRMTEEAGEGFRLSNPKSDANGKIEESVIYRINQPREIDGRKVMEFEMHRAGIVTNTDLMTVEDQGILCWGRVDGQGEVTKLNPAQIIVRAPLKTGLTWKFDNEVAESPVHQSYAVVGEEEVVVPAGKFHAFHIHGEQSAPGKMIIDRWFSDGIGIIKDVTETRSADDKLLRRISLELTDAPKVAPRPEVASNPSPSPSALTATLGNEAIGDSTTEFSVSTPKINARWQGRALRVGARIRVVWIAENVTDIAPPDYTIDEAATTATAPDSHGTFALSRPENGWTPGLYRVEFYIDGVFADAVKLQIKALPPTF